MYINDIKLGAWFEEVAKILNDKEKIKIASNYITTDFIGIKKANLAVKPPSSKNFSELITLFAENSISSRVAKDILAMIAIRDESPEKIATEQNLFQNYDEDALKEFITENYF